MSRFRQPKTRAEQAANEQFRELVRNKRHILPNAWDDKPPVIQRSWKKHRKNRWK